MTRFALSLIGIVLVSAACSAGDTAVRPFEDIAVGDPAISFDASGTTATLTIATNIDAVCAVTYGPTEALGFISTDQDMGGGAHDDHQAVMSGLQPETTYQYRLQGVGADGRLYRSELRTFTTPAASDAFAGLTNVARGATVVEVSSEFSDSFAAANAFDGDRATEWATRGDGDDAFVVIDLGAPADVEVVVFDTRSMSDGSSITSEFTITVDGGSVLGPFPAGLVDVTFTGQVVRFDVAVSTGGNTGAVEIEVFAARG